MWSDQLHTPPPPQPLHTYYIEDTPLPALTLSVNRKVQNRPWDTGLPCVLPIRHCTALSPFTLYVVNTHTHTHTHTSSPTTAGITQPSWWWVTHPCRHWLLTWDQFALGNPPKIRVLLITPLLGSLMRATPHLPGLRSISCFGIKLNWQKTKWKCLKPHNGTESKDSHCFHSANIFNGSSGGRHFKGVMSHFLTSCGFSLKVFSGPLKLSILRLCLECDETYDRWNDY